MNHLPRQLYIYHHMITYAFTLLQWRDGVGGAGDDPRI